MYCTQKNQTEKWQKTPIRELFVPRGPEPQPHPLDPRHIYSWQTSSSGRDIPLLHHHHHSPNHSISIQRNEGTRGLPPRQLAALHHGGVLLLEALAQAGGALEELVDAAQHAAFLAGDEGLGGEVVDAVVEAALDELGVHLRGGVSGCFLSLVQRTCGLCWIKISKTKKKNKNKKGEVNGGGKEGTETYRHKLLHLLLLHASRELALLGSVESADRYPVSIFFFSPWRTINTYPSMVTRDEDGPGIKCGRAES